jgi:hypothetical protein
MLTSRCSCTPCLVLCKSRAGRACGAQVRSARVSGPSADRTESVAMAQQPRVLVLQGLPTRHLDGHRRLAHIGPEAATNGQAQTGQIVDASRGRITWSMVPTSRHKALGSCVVWLQI